MIVFGILILAFFRVQILNSAKYTLQSETNRLRAFPIPAPRGLIVDRNGVVLAENVPGYSIAVLAPSRDSLLATIDRLRPTVAVGAAVQDRVLRRYERHPTEPVVVLRDAPFAVVSALEERRAWIPGLVVQSEPKRRYPYREVAAHVVGYVGEVTEGELQGDRGGDLRGGALVGRDGTEARYDERLRGRDGSRFVEVDALGRIVREAHEEGVLQPQPGETIRTSIDIRLQERVHEVFRDSFPGGRGAVVAMDVRSGEVLALYSAPSYDPNEFIGGLDPERWDELRTSTNYPLLNRAIQARYPPASPWKLVVAAMALERGIVSMGSYMPDACRGGLQYYNRYFRCWKLDGHGDLNLTEAITQSCDVYFYQLGLKLGLENMLRDGVRMGFRQPTGIDLPDEKQPIFPPSREYFNRLYGPRGWTSAVTLNLAIGQGENSQTLINMVRFYAMLANERGRAPDPHIVPVAGVTPGQRLELSPRILEGLREALLMVVERGTARGTRMATLAIGGKTGTAQNAHGADHGWFIGFAPVEDPEIVVGAIVEFAEHGSTVARRLVRPIISQHFFGAADAEVRADFVLPADSAPEPLPILPGVGPRGTVDTTNRGTGTR